MSNLIDFLERLGEDAELRHASKDVLEEALRGAGIDPALRATILGVDQRKLEALISAEPNVCCAVHKEDEEEEEEPGEGEEEEEEEEGEEEEEK